MRQGKRIKIELCALFFFLALMSTIIADIVINPPRTPGDFTTSGVYYHNSGGNAYITTYHPMRFRKISVDRNFVMFNDTGFAISSPNRVNISLVSLGSDILDSEVNQTVASFYAQGIQGTTASFSISGFHQETNYTINRGGSTIASPTADESGTISFSSSLTSGNQLFTINQSSSIPFPAISWNGGIRIILPSEVFENESTKVLMQLADSNGNIMSGIASLINVTIVSGTHYLALNAHPVEISFYGQSLYEYDFMPDRTGGYLVYVVCGNQAGSNMFVSKFGIADNSTAQQKRTETIIALEHNGRMDMMMQATYSMFGLSRTYSNITQRQMSFSLIDALQATALDGALQVLFYALLFMGVFIGGSVIMTRKSERERLFEEMKGAPTAVKVAKVATKGIEREGRRHKPY